MLRKLRLLLPVSRALSLKIRLGSRPYSPENRLFLIILPTKFKISARIVNL